MEIRIFGIADGGMPACLGSKVFNVANYAGKMKLKMEICLDESPFSRNKLHVQMTIVSLPESKKITEAFLRGEPELVVRTE